ncbi:MAG: SLATT domain-containing protein [Fuerstia sp.]|nr:SLATT domain-containing protein [Fuerstiella sp.]
MADAPVNLSEVKRKTHLERLYDRVSKTAASRFHASRRLSYHNQVSLWTISFFSLGLVFVSLVQSIGFVLPYPDKTINLVQVFLSITILVISAIMTMSNYAVRAERYHACGLEMNDLALKLERRVEKDGTVDEHNTFANIYGEILKRYENHHSIDFMFMKIQKSERYKLPWWYPGYVHVRFSVQFLPYIALLGMEFVWIFTLISNTSFNSVK